MNEGRGPRAANGPPLNVVTKNAGLNRFVWGMQDAAGLGMAPGQYQARLTIAGRAHTQPFTVLIDPRLAAEGTTVVDLREQHAHNTRVRALVTDVNGAVTTGCR